MRPTLSPIVLCAAACALAAGAWAQGAGAVAATRAGTIVSSNWAGYAVTITRPDAAGAVTGAGAFTAVAATWVQPQTMCPPQLPSAYAVWVGLGGFTDEARGLEQIGTVTVCDAKGAVSHSVLYEILPSFAVEVKLKVRTGDRIRAAVSVSGRQVAFTLKNLTRGTRFSKRVAMTADPDLSSAEWIVEAPFFCPFAGLCLPLAPSNFGAVTISAAAAIGDGRPGRISDPAWSADAIELVSEYSLDSANGETRIGAVPGALSGDGGLFDITWRSDLVPPAAEPLPGEEWRLSQAAIARPLRAEEVERRWDSRSVEASPS